MVRHGIVPVDKQEVNLYVNFVMPTIWTFLSKKCIFTNILAMVAPKHLMLIFLLNRNEKSKLEI